jgi:hypothetical protein
VNDLDIEGAAPSSINALAAKGHKVFKSHPAGKVFYAEYHNLDRLAM